MTNDVTFFLLFIPFYLLREFCCITLLQKKTQRSNHTNMKLKTFFLLAIIAFQTLMYSQTIHVKIFKVTDEENNQSVPMMLLNATQYMWTTK